VAALSHVLVVVECHQRAGSLHTVRAATERGISVGAVPGSIRSPASAGTNDLLADGCFPVRDVTDVMVALALARSGDSPVPWARPREPGVRRNAAIPTVERGEPTESEARTHRAVGAIAAAAAAGDTNGAGGATTEISVLLLDAMGWEQCSIDQLLRRTGRSLAEVSLGIERLAAAGAVRSCGSSWERA
jgi:predicted Rossmann fold nucleotide-binding protein DprA/Smf involved in DNA uptake